MGILIEYICIDMTSCIVHHDIDSSHSFGRTMLVNWKLVQFGLFTVPDWGTMGLSRGLQRPSGRIMHPSDEMMWPLGSIIYCNNITLSAISLPPLQAADGGGGGAAVAGPLPRAAPANHLRLQRGPHRLPAGEPANEVCTYNQDMPRKLRIGYENVCIYFSVFHRS